MKVTKELSAPSRATLRALGFGVAVACVGWVVGYLLASGMLDGSISARLRGFDTWTYIKIGAVVGFTVGFASFLIAHPAPTDTKLKWVGAVFVIGFLAITAAVFLPDSLMFR